MRSSGKDIFKSALPSIAAKNGESYCRNRAGKTARGKRSEREGITVSYTLQRSTVQKSIVDGNINYQISNNYSLL